MGIGTSLGAYYETDLDHHAGNQYLLEPNSTPDNNELSTNEVMPQTPEPVDPSHYETPLTPDQEVRFQDWKGKNAPKDSGQDYDLRGAFLNNVTPDSKTGHWPDTFKKPNHPTFSDQSMYAGERPDLAGRWQGDVYIPPLPLTKASFTEKGGTLTPIERINQYPEMFEAGRQALEIEKKTGRMPKINQKGLIGGSIFKDDLS